ncbi:MAG: hypothetical protein VXW22_10230 [Pseudomonadota bacterium]|nr:hypothetical protein [Pseudomonadota bacterium]
MAHTETHTWRDYTLTIDIVDGETTDASVDGPDGIGGTWNSVVNEATLYQGPHDDEQRAPAGLVKFVEKTVWDYEERHEAHYKHN